jgi:hypothetical protein
MSYFDHLALKVVIQTYSHIVHRSFVWSKLYPRSGDVCMLFILAPCTEVLGSSSGEERCLCDTYADTVH